MPSDLVDPQRKRSPKGKEVMDGGKSQPSKEKDEAPRTKQLKIEHQGRAKKLKSKLLKARERGLRPSPYRVPGFLPQCFMGAHYWKQHP